jgi:hypothetical protein
MEFRCINCGALLTPPARPDATVTCHFCGAPQKPGPTAASPYAALPPQLQPSHPGFGIPPGGFGRVAPGIVRPAGRVPRSNVGIILAVVGAVLGLGGAALAVMLASSGAARTGMDPTSTGAPTALPMARLATLSLRQTPEAMAKITGVAPTKDPSGDLAMRVPLSGGAWDALNVVWDASDPTHAKEVFTYASTAPANDAAIRQRVAAHLGRRFDKNDNFFFNGAYFSYGGTYARAAADLKISTDPNLHWKDQVDAMWDVLRASVLGLDVAISNGESRDWLGRGYPLTALGAIDPGIDVDRSTAAMQSAFPAVHSQIVNRSTGAMQSAFPAVHSQMSIRLQHTLAVDHPWYGEVEVKWPNAKGGTLEEAWLRPPPQMNNKFASQADVEACVKAAFGPPHRRYEGDHLGGDYSTDWQPAEGGEIRVYGQMVDVTVTSPFAPKKMSQAGWRKAMNALDACGRPR